MSSLSHASAQGLRAEQQDRWVCTWLPTSGCEGQLMAVIDGHGGHETADVVAQELVAVFEKALQGSKTNIERAIQETFKQLDLATRKQVSGTTLSLAFVPPANREVYVGILGDSPVAILDANGHLRIGPLHNVRSNIQERAAAISRGGAYVQGYIQDRDHPQEGLQLSRSFGDSALGRILNRQPDIHRVELNAASFIFLATDGILDSFDQEIDPQIQHLVARIGEGWSAETFVQDALKRQTGDNVTVLLWRAS